MATVRGPGAPEPPSLGKARSVGHGAFEQIATVLAVCVAAGALSTLLRLPLMVGLMAAGIAVGPSVFGLVDATSEIELLATVGISLLLFVVGLKLDVRLLRRLGPVAAATGLGQVVLPRCWATDWRGRSASSTWLRSTSHSP